MYNTYIELINQLSKQKVMVIGDMVADVYLEGKISRISREAPVLILEHENQTVVPGGAANAVHNTATLGGEVFAVGVVGNDSAGYELIRVLESKSAKTEGLIIDDGRPTITKTRVMAGGQATVRQQVVRVDRESKQDLEPAVEQKVLAYIEDKISSMSAVVISDYGSKSVTSEIVSYVITRCQQLNKHCIVDSRYNVMGYRGVTIVKQNESEAAAALGCKTLDRAQLLTAGHTILERLEAEAVLITQGPDGMTLFERNGKYTHIPVTNKSEVYDVTGAGDTVVATMALAISTGVSYLEAACLANYAAGVVVRKPGTATTNPAELKAAIGVYYENRQS
ncbi:bifunctional heptose 7-phosphate kinase/heptose 1-phosphate adenyltransferase [Dendrosporobacter sp. 1207_IL3150]|uniref:bifunctional heptose 7-phosphate kinase/heptose 1-phosphate adenyltransferase n=1 Tax=Dendrosporobacter sp. 1207_IL3150 TaxID=3084054 RepID=UPI002FD8AAFA